MEQLPNNVIAEIMAKADVPIDTRLYYRKYGWTRRSVHIPAVLRANLDHLLANRAQNYSDYCRLRAKSPLRWSSTIDARVHYVSNTVYYETFVTEMDGDIHIGIKKVCFHGDNSASLFDMDCKTYDIHTGLCVDE